MSDFFNDVEHLDAAIGGALGYISRCWDPKASQMVNELLSWIDANYTLTPKINRTRNFQSGWPPHKALEHSMRGVLTTEYYESCLDCDEDCTQANPCNCCSELLAREASLNQNPKQES